MGNRISSIKGGEADLSPPDYEVYTAVTPPIFVPISARAIKETGTEKGILPITPVEEFMLGVAYTTVMTNVFTFPPENLEIVVKKLLVVN